MCLWGHMTFIVFITNNRIGIKIDFFSFTFYRGHPKRYQIMRSARGNNLDWVLPLNSMVFFEGKFCGENSVVAVVVLFLFNVFFALVRRVSFLFSFPLDEFICFAGVFFGLKIRKCKQCICCDCFFFAAKWILAFFLPYFFIYRMKMATYWP